VPTVAFLLAADTPPGGGMGGIVVPLVLVMLVFYFIVIRPQSRERKHREAQLAALKKHDKVVTNAGIHGTVVEAQGDVIVLRVDEKNNVRMRFSKSAIWQVLTGDEEKKPVPERPEPTESAS
jgi:preprotein translocase subunit YajC